MNNVSFYFRTTINGKEYASMTLQKLFVVAAEKYVACCVEFKLFHMNKGSEFGRRIDHKICQILYIVIRAFFKYLVCNVRDPVIGKQDYDEFFHNSLYYFVQKFGQRKALFKDVYRILKAKQQKPRKETGGTKWELF